MLNFLLIKLKTSPNVNCECIGLCLSLYLQLYISYAVVSNAAPNTYLDMCCLYIDPSISSLSASSSTQLNITLTAPDNSSSLTYKCTISTTVSGLSTKTVNGTVLQYTVDGLSPYVKYTVECTSSNGEDYCDYNMDTIRMPSTSEMFVIILLCILIYTI